MECRWAICCYLFVLHVLLYTNNTSSPFAVNIKENFQMFLSDVLAEHLQEIRALRQRLEESIQTNDRLREQLERRLDEVEKDPGTHLTYICKTFPVIRLTLLFSD